MPVSSVDFRGVCGCFHAVLINFMLKRAKFKAASRVKTVKLRTRSTGVLVGILLTLIFFGDLIHRCGDVELNPGPTVRQSRLTSEPRSKSDKNDSATATPPRSSVSSGSQGGDPTLRDVMDTLLNMNQKFDDMKQDFSVLKDCFETVRGEMADLKKEISDVKQDNASLKEENDMLRSRLEKVEIKTDDLENRSKRNNILIYGIPREANEDANQRCEPIVQRFIKDKLALDCDIPFDRVHRVSSKPDSPIIARCVNFKDKVTMLKARLKLKGTKIFLGEDFSQRVRDVRKRLQSHLKAAKAAGKRATMVYDHLMIDGRRFDLDADGTLKEVR